MNSSFQNVLSKMELPKIEKNINGDGEVYAGWLCQVPIKLWTACYIRNRSPTKAEKGRTPYEALSVEKPAFGHLPVFGCAAYCQIPKDERWKLDDKSRNCIFLEYSLNRKGCWLYGQDRCRVIYNWDVSFNELSHGAEEKNSPTKGYVLLLWYWSVVFIKNGSGLNE